MFVYIDFYGLPLEYSIIRETIYGSDNSIIFGNLFRNINEILFLRDIMQKLNIYHDYRL